MSEDLTQTRKDELEWCIVYRDPRWKTERVQRRGLTFGYAMTCAQIAAGGYPRVHDPYDPTWTVYHESQLPEHLKKED